MEMADKLVESTYSFTSRIVNLLPLEAFLRHRLVNPIVTCSSVDGSVPISGDPICKRDLHCNLLLQ